MVPSTLGGWEEASLRNGILKYRAAQLGSGVCVRITVFDETPVVSGLFRDLMWTGAPGEIPGERDLAGRLAAHAMGAAALGRAGPGAR